MKKEPSFIFVHLLRRKACLLLIYPTQSNSGFVAKTAGKQRGRIIWRHFSDYLKQIQLRRRLQGRWVVGIKSSLLLPSVCLFPLIFKLLTSEPTKAHRKKEGEGLCRVNKHLSYGEKSRNFCLDSGCVCMCVLKHYKQILYIVLSIISVKFELCSNK